MKKAYQHILRASHYTYKWRYGPYTILAQSDGDGGWDYRVYRTRLIRDADEIGTVHDLDAAVALCKEHNK